MEADIWQIFFQTCDSSKTEQQWVIWKTENDRNNIVICQRHIGPLFYKHNCLAALDVIRHPSYSARIRHGPPIQPNNEARDIMTLRYNRLRPPHPSQLWHMNSTTHQLASVQFPKVCITTKHFDDPTRLLLVECNGYGYNSPNPQLNKHQNFYLKPALDQNNEPLCYAD